MFKVIVNNKEFGVELSGSEFTVDGKPAPIDILKIKPGTFHVIRNNKSFNAEIIGMKEGDKSIIIRINNRTYTAAVKDKFDDLLQEMGIDLTGSKKVNDIKAPMPGLVLHVLVQSGQPIQKGDAIVVLEAMKMENILKSPSDGIVKKIHVVKGDKVEKNQVMVNLV